MKLSQTLDSVSLQFVEANFKFNIIKSTEGGKDIIADNKGYGNDWIKFFADGKAAYSPTGSIDDLIPFHSHQDAVDFIRIK